MQGANLDANIQMSSTDVPLLLHSLLSVHSQLRGLGVLPRYICKGKRWQEGRGCLKAAPQRYPQLSMQFAWFAKRANISFNLSAVVKACSNALLMDNSFKGPCPVGINWEFLARGRVVYHRMQPPQSTSVEGG